MLVSAFIAPQEKASNLVRRLTLVSFVVAIFLTIYNGYQPAYAFNGQFFTSSFMVYMKVIILLGAIGILLLSKRELKHDQINRPELPLLMLLSVLV